MNRGKDPQLPVEYQSSPKYEDEIDLADLVGVLYRRRWLIIIGTLLISVLVVGMSFLTEKEYEVTTFLEIGQLFTGEGQNVAYQPVEPIAAVKNRLNSIAKIAARDFSSAKSSGNSEDNIIPNPDALEITVHEKGNIVEISATVPKDSNALSYLSKINEMLIADHDPFFDQKQEKLHNEIEKLKVEKETLTVEDETLEIPILKNMQEQVKDLTFMFYSPVSKTIPELKARIEELKRSYDVKKTEYKNDIMNCENRIESLKEQKESHPDRKEINRKIDNKQAEKKLLTKKLSNLDADLKDRIQTVKTQIAELKNKRGAVDIKISNIESELENMITTRVLTEPYYSDQPVSSNRKLFAAGGFAGGMFIMLVLAFAIEFFQANRERITGKPMERESEQ